VIVNTQKRRLAPVLRDLDLVDTPRLELALAMHIREMLLTTLGWEQAALLFEDQELPDPPAEDLTLRCSTAELILDLVRRIPDPETVRRGLGSLERALAVVEKPPFRADRAKARADSYVLSRANGSTSARSMIQTSALAAEEVERSLLGLLCIGIVRYVPAPPKLQR
jgi:hypothetical protein